MESETRQYELDYLLRGDLGGEKTEELSGDIREAIEKEGGIVSEADKPQKKNLGYPIKKHETAYFGRFQFILPAEKLELLNKSFAKLDLLRLLVSKVKYAKAPSRQATKKRLIRQIKTDNKEILSAEETALQKGPVLAQVEPASPSEGLNGQASPGPGGSLQVEEIDKKLEEILGE